VIPRRTRRTLRLAVARHRRLVVAGCVAGAVAAGLRAVSPEPPPTQAVWVAAADLPAGTTLTGDDVVPVRWLVGTSPPATLDADEAAGRRLATPMRRGEPLTDVRVAGPGLLEGQPPGTLAVPVPLANASAAALVRPGDVVDVLAAAAPGLDLAGATASAPAEVVAQRVLVLGVLADDHATGGLLAGAAAAAGNANPVLVVATDETSARSLSGAGTGRELSVVVRAP
jgi:Flp pilus assembly protein CpaB